MTDPGPARSEIRLIRAASTPPPALPPPDLPVELDALAPPRIPPLRGIRAALFDVYGTLFVSAAGEIGAAESSQTGPVPDRLAALAGEHSCSATELRDYFRAAVLERHEALRGKTAYPELRVEELWAEFLVRRGESSGGARELALRYELAVNPAYPMPAAAEALALLRSRGFVLGLISNAQFFTPLLFEAFFGAPPEALGFDSGLLIYSFALGEAKPSPNLFVPAARRLEALGLKPENALYVGNDMLNDIAAASRAGFKTALFAGDRRSLRLREGDQRTAEIMPDRVLRSLGDLSGLVA
ncbi:MAG: HAD family hydrolase [Treponema sp.]|jgi:putative hydrolase of the HAD superfamily|nr:HAD family hydrolase [Treponema sp.]